MRKSVTFQTGLCLYFMLVAIIPLALLGLFTHFIVANGLEEDIRRDMRAVSQRVRGEMMATLQIPKVLLGELDVAIKNNSGAIRPLMASTLRISDIFESVALIGYDGRITEFAATPDYPVARDNLLGAELASYDYRAVAKEIGTGFSSDVTLSPVTGNLVLAIFTESLNGILVGHIKLDWLNRITAQVQDDSGLLTMILDKNGVLIRSNDPSRDQQKVNLSNLAIVAAGLDYRWGTYHFKDRGTKLFGVVHDIPETGWLLILARPTAEAFAQLSDLRWIIFLGVLAATALAVVVAVSVSRKLNKPLDSLIQITRRMAAGERRVTAHIKGFAEFEALAHDFSLMAEEVARHEGALQKLSVAVEQSPASVIITDIHGRIEYVNPKFLESTGYEEAEVIGQNPSILKSGHTSSERYRELWSTVLSGDTWRGEFLNRRKSGDTFWEQATIAPITNDDGEITHLLAVKEDITERKEYEERLHRQANYDSLTGLPNRTLAYDRLGQAIVAARRENRMMGLLYLDVDQFKRINDTLGHGAGDRLLQSTAERLRSCLREQDTVARLGGDEFAVILPDLETREDAERVALKIKEKLTPHLELSGHQVFVTASVGVAVYPLDGTDAQSMIKNADSAMYRAKEEGRDNFQFYSPDINERFQHRLSIETQMRSALERSEFYLVYQPIVAAQTGAIVAAEALIRWNNEALGNVYPDQFIPIAEDTGLIVPIGDWVLDTALAEAARWRNVTGRLFLMNVNFSSRQFRFGNITATVRDLLEHHNLPPEALGIEITESLILDATGGAGEALRELAELGVDIAVDDFGTGYSSLSYLKQLPISSLKIDREFVRDCVEDASDATLVRTIVAMAHTLGLSLIAEGVEETAQLEFLKELDCHHIQGYLIGKPMSGDDLLALLQRDGGCLPTSPEAASG